MKITLYTIVCIALLALSGCSLDNNCKHVMPLHYKTSRHEGINYYRTPITLDFTDGLLIFENTSEMPIKLSVYNRTDSFKLHYEFVLEPKHHVSYCGLDKDAKYDLGLSVISGKGSKDVSLLAYNSYDYFKAKSNSDKCRLVNRDRSKFDDFIDKLGLVLIL